MPGVVPGPALFSQLSFFLWPALFLLLAALLLLAARTAAAHDGATHSPKAEPAELQQNAAGKPDPAPGAFAIPAPGHYALPPLGKAEDGLVLTASSESVRLYSLFGDGIVLLSFIYTRCSDAEGCPLATAVLHGVGARVGREPEVSQQLRLLSL